MPARGERPHGDVSGRDVGEAGVKDLGEAAASPASASKAAASGAITLSAPKRSASGAPKVGLLAGEAVVVLEPSLVAALSYLREQSTQLARRCASSPRSWRRCCAGASGAAPPFTRTRWRRLAEGVDGALTLTQAVQAIAVFAILPPGAAERQQGDFRFHVWDEHTGEVRRMCSWDTTEADVGAFVAAILGVVEAAVR